MTITLRPHQAKGVSQIREALDRVDRVLYVLPTRGGKTYVFCHLIEGWQAAGVLVLVHRDRLLRQCAKSLDRLGIEHGTITSRRKIDHSQRVQVASVDTTGNRLQQLDPGLFGYVIIDEAHHAVAPKWAKVLEHFQGAKVLGVTATPARLDGRGLAPTFQKMVLGPSIRELVELGHVAPSRVFVPPSDFTTDGLRKVGGDWSVGSMAPRLSGTKIVGDVVKHYQQLLAPNTAVVFCCTVTHAEQTAQRFRDAGISAASIDGRMTPDAQETLLQDLEVGRLKVLTSCELIGEGVDLPSVGGCILMRGTASLAKFLQMVARCLTAEDGKVGKIIDMVGAYGPEGHGHHEDEREWSLDEGVRKVDAGAAGIRTCPECFCSLEPRTVECPECGHQFDPRELKVVQIDGELVEYWGEMDARLRERHGESLLKEIANLGEPFAMSHPLVLAYLKVVSGKQPTTYNCKIALRQGLKGLGFSFVLAGYSDAQPFRDAYWRVLSKNEVSKLLAQRQRMAKTEQELRKLGFEFGMARPHIWATHVMAARQRTLRNRQNPNQLQWT